MHFCSLARFQPFISLLLIPLLSLSSHLLRVITYPSTGGRGEKKKVSSHEENAWIFHQRLFKGKHEKNQKEVCEF